MPKTIKIEITAYGTIASGKSRAIRTMITSLREHFNVREVLGGHKLNEEYQLLEAELINA